MASLASRKHGRQDVGLPEKNKKVEYQLNLDANAY